VNNQRDTGCLRILILSSPKTGNTWLKNLLSAVYDLPPVGLVHPFNAEQASALGDRWVAFDHLRPGDGLLDWVREFQPILLTTIRHPGDVLISLYHHVNGFERESVDHSELRRMLHEPFNRSGVEAPWEGGTFSADLACSIEWIKTGLPIVVRYEDLWRDTAGTLAKVAGRIGPIDSERIDRAVERSDLGLMRALAGKHGGFFRAGRVGDWRAVLSPEIIGDLQQEPYRSQFEALGYTLDPADPLIAAPAKPRASRNPFRGVSCFSDGTPVAPIIVKLYLSKSAQFTAQWGEVTRTGRGSFFEWLNSPAEDLPRNRSTLFLSNLAHFAYQDRPDLQQAFVDLSGDGLAGYAEWLVRNGASELELHPAFLNPVEAGLLKWAGGRAAEDRSALASWPELTNFALYFYRMRLDAQHAFPDVFGWDRRPFLEWAVANAEELNLYDPLIAPVRRNLQHLEEKNPFRTVARFENGVRVPSLAVKVYLFSSPALTSRWGDVSKTGPGSFFEWLNRPFPAPPRGIYSSLQLSNLAHYLYRERPDLQRAFPDLSGAGRLQYAAWFVRHAAAEAALDPAFTEVVRESIFRWAASRSADDPSALPWWPPLTNFALHLYGLRTDAQRAFPSVFGSDRWNFLRWAVDHTDDLAVSEPFYPGFIEPVRDNLQKWARIRSIGRFLPWVRH
jgi:Sulfotransferase domain